MAQWHRQLTSYYTTTYGVLTIKQYCKNKIKIKGNDQLTWLENTFSQCWYAQKQKCMTRVGFEPTPSYDDQETVKLGIKVDLNLTPWTNSAILPWDIICKRNSGIWVCLSVCRYIIVGNSWFLLGVGGGRGLRWGNGWSCVWGKIRTRVIGSERGDVFITTVVV